MRGRSARATPMRGTNCGRGRAEKISGPSSHGPRTSGWPQGLSHPLGPSSPGRCRLMLGWLPLSTPSVPRLANGHEKRDALRREESPLPPCWPFRRATVVGRRVPPPCKRRNAPPRSQCRACTTDAYHLRAASLSPVPRRISLSVRLPGLGMISATTGRTPDR